MRPSRLTALALASIILALGGSVTRSASLQKKVKLDTRLSRMAVNANAARRVRVIVTPAIGAGQAVSQKLQRRGRAVLAWHRSINAITADVAVADLRTLAADPAIDHVSIDARVRNHATAVPPLAQNTLLPTLGLDDRTLTGSGVGVAVIDSGIEAAPELPVAAFFDFTRGGVAATPYDDYGHGTHVAGIIATTDTNTGARYRSVASRARLIGLKVLDADGSAYTSTVIQAIDFAVANRAGLGIDVINLSLGHPIYEPAATDPLVRAVERAVAAGLVVVCSAGNLGANPQTGEIGYAGITSPGNALSAITVGAVDTQNTASRSDDSIARFSSRGPSWYDGYAKPDIVAPGRHIVSAAPRHSTLYAQYPDLGARVASHAYLSLSGTSMAAAVASGTVALMIEASRATNPARLSLTPNAIKAILEFTALPLAGENVLTQGAGAINPAGAAALVSAIDPLRAVGDWWLVDPVDTTTTIDGEILTWAQRLVWGNRVIWGSAIYANEDAWAERVIWGNRVIWGTQVAWGEDEVWGDRLVWGARLVWGNACFSVDANRVLWGSADDDRVIWGNLDDDRVIWGAADPNDDRVIWGNASTSSACSLTFLESSSIR